MDGITDAPALTINSNCRIFRKRETFAIRDSTIIGPLYSRGLQIAMRSLMHEQCWSRAMKAAKQRDQQYVSRV